MAFHYAEQFLSDPLFLYPHPTVLEELETQLLTLIPKWAQYIIRKWPNHYVAYLLTGIKIRLIINTDQPGKTTTTIEIWKNFKLRTSLEYTKETYITEINKETKIKLEDTDL